MLLFFCFCCLLQEKDYDQADRYAELAMSADRYNPAALINKGNTVFVKEDYEKAAEFYKEALRNDSSCTEALYNLGLQSQIWHPKGYTACTFYIHALTILHLKCFWDQDYALIM